METNPPLQVRELRKKLPADWAIPDFRIAFWHGKTTNYCVVIPVINEGDRIRQFVRRLKDIRIDAIADIIIVDGGSTDGSFLLSRCSHHRWQ